MSETEYEHSVAGQTFITFRTPRVQDGVAVWRAVEQAGMLEQNTAYFYLIFCSDFADTCLIAQDGEEIAGFVIGYQPPNEPNTAFVWQVGVLSAWRGQGLGKRLLGAWLELPVNQQVQWVTATVADDNAASDQLFRALAKSLQATCVVTPHFKQGHFPAGHRPESIYRIGPISRDALERI